MASSARMRWLIFAIAIFGGVPGHAVIIATGDGTGNTTAPADDPGWANVGTRTTGLTVIYLGNGWVLTANHVGVGDVVLAGQTYSAVPGSGYELVNPDSTLADLLLFQINGQPPLPLLPIATAPTTTSSIATLIGHGVDRGAATSWNGIDGFLWASNGNAMRWGTAPVSQVGVHVSLNGDLTQSFATQFTPVGGTAFPAQAAVGDSGGAAFVKVNGTWMLVGVLFATDAYNGQPPYTSLYGNHTYAADLYSYRGQIVSRVPVPIKWLAVGPPGNGADNPANCYGGNCGFVGYYYDISQYQVTNAQYAEFLNAKAASDPLGLYDLSMGSDTVNGGITQSGVSGRFTYAVNPGFESTPVTYVSFYSALRFANWMNNGKGTGDTESGSYTLLGGTPIPSNATSVTRNPGANIFLPSENEWYKAAYYSQDGSGVYFAYPYGTNTTTTCAAPSATANTANCNRAVGGVTVAGSYSGSRSPSGAFDQGGNVEEWTDGIVPGTFNTVVRGASWSDPASDLAAGFLESQPPSSATSTIGFRVVRMTYEPIAVSAGCGLGSELALILPPLLWLRDRRRRNRE